MSAARYFTLNAHNSDQYWSGSIKYGIRGSSVAHVGFAGREFIPVMPKKNLKLSMHPKNVVLSKYSRSLKLTAFLKIGRAFDIRDDSNFQKTIVVFTTYITPRQLFLGLNFSILRPGSIREPDV